MSEVTPDTKGQDPLLDFLRRSAEMAKGGIALQDMDWPNTVLFLLDRIALLEASLRQSEEAYAWDMLLPEDEPPSVTGERGT